MALLDEFEIRRLLKETGGGSVPMSTQAWRALFELALEKDLTDEQASDACKRLNAIKGKPQKSREPHRSG